MKTLLISFFFIYFSLHLYADTPNAFTPMHCPMAQHKGFVYEANIRGEKIKLPFGIFLPEKYESEPNRKWPLIMFLHGGGEIGTDLNGVFVHGISKEASANPAMIKNFPFIICLPQSNIGQEPQSPGIYTGWDNKMSEAMVALLKELPKSFRIDMDRVILTGLSMGGNGTWSGLNTDPKVWAAAVPISGRAWKDPTDLATKLRFCSIWTIGGLVDAPHFVDGARRMHKSLVAEGCDSQLTLIPDVGHFAWMFHYNNPEFFHWMAHQIKPTDDMITQAEAFRKLENGENGLTNRNANLKPGRKDNSGLVAGFSSKWFRDIEFKNLLIQRIDKSFEFTDGYNLPDQIKENVSLNAVGWVNIQKTGRYTFTTFCDDGSKLKIGDEILIDDWNPHGVIEQTGYVTLEKGWHKITIEYFQGGGPGSISVFWSGPNMPRKLLTDADVFCEPK